MLLNSLYNLKAEYIPSGSYRSNFLTMATGRLFAQAIPILLTPVLTRLYSPQDFGAFAIFVALTAILSLFANGRYSLALMLPKKNSDVLSIFFLTVFINLVFSISVFLIILFFRTTLLELFNLQGSFLILYLLPLGIFIIGLFEPLYQLAIKNKLFKELSLILAIQFSLIALLKIGFYFLDFGSFGLIMGHLLGYLLGISIAIIILFSRNVFRDFQFSATRKSIIKSANIYKKFPMYSLPADTLNSLSQQLPNLLINNFFGGMVLGYFSLNQRILASPLSTISSAISDVFRERASFDYRKSGSCREIFKKTFKKMFLFFILPFFLLFLFAPQFIPAIFGEGWGPAGDYIRIMSILFFLRASISPLTSVLYITGKQIYKLIWEILSVLVIFISFWLGYNFFDEYLAITIYSFSLSFLYILLLLISYVFTEDKK